MDQMRAERDPAFAMKLAEDARHEMETAEIKNGRLAMLAITGMALQEFVWGTPVVDQTPIFVRSPSGLHRTRRPGLTAFATACGLLGITLSRCAW